MSACRQSGSEAKSTAPNMLSQPHFPGSSSDSLLRLIPLKPVHAEVAAAIQAGAMAAGTGDEAWSARAIADLLEMQGSFGWLALHGDENVPNPIGLVFCRTLSGEGEVLVLAVLPTYWRKGVGRALLATALEQAAAVGIRRMLLEVAIDNDSARALYESFGFVTAGRRRAYYRRPHGQPVDALTMDLFIDR